MSRIKPFLAVVLCLVMASPIVAQSPNSGGYFSRLTKDYRPHPMPAISFEDSPRIERLIRAGRIYLSLRDAIALALENNLDIEVARITPK